MNILNFIKQNGKWIALILFVLIIFIRTKVRKYFWKVRKTGEKLKFKEFLGKWRKGVEGITPIQQIKSQVLGIWITLTGIICGIVVNIIIRLRNVWWWLTIILVGSLLITLIQMIGALQKYWILKKVNDEVKKLDE